MSTGSGIQPRRGVEVSNITPQVNLRSGTPELWDEATRTFDRLTEAGRPNLVRRAQARGQAEGEAIAAGEAAPKDNLLQTMFGGDIQAARMQARETAFMARTRGDIDVRLGEARREHRYDPDAFARVSEEIINGFIDGAPPEWTVDVGTYVRGKASDLQAVVSEQRAMRDEQEVTQATTVRANTLQDRLVALASEGKTQTMEYLQASAEYGALQNERQDNPAILYSEDQRLADDEKLDGMVLGATASRGAVETYTENGRGLVGFAAAARFMNDEVLNGEAFAELNPEDRQRIYRDGMSQLRDYAAVDREEEKVRTEQEREQREAQRARRDELRLDILTGGIDESAIRGDAGLDDASKATLINLVHGQERRAQQDAVRDAALERSEARDVYQGYADQAHAGTLTAAELADAREGGLITAGQMTTLRVLNDKTLKPIADDVLAPSRERARGRRNTSRSMMIAEQAATLWARANPEATLEQRLTAGNVIRDRAFGGPAMGAPVSGQAAAQGVAARVQAVNADIAARRAAGRPYSTAEANRLRREAQNGD